MQDLPRNLDAERALLQSIMLDPRHYKRLGPRILPDLFDGELHREFAGVMARIHRAGLDITMLAALEETIRASISRKGPRTFVLPGILKITAVAVPAKKARKGVNPFTGEETTFKAKPATVKVNVRPMKRLKDAASV